MTCPDAVMALVNEAGHVGGEQPSRLPHDHDALVDQKGWGQAGVDDRAHVDVIARTAADLFDHEGVVALPHHLGQQPAHLLGHERRVVALDEIRRCAHSAALIRLRSFGRAHSAALTAASASRTRRVPCTSCTRRIRQPQDRPSAAAPRDAGPRSVRSRSNMTPRNVLFDAESSSG